MMISGVKTFQPPKAMGLARTVLRSTMFPFLVLPLPPSNTDFGSEPSPLPTNLVDPDLSKFGHCRLEPVAEDVKMRDERIKTKEAFDFFYLPAPGGSSGDSVDGFRDFLHVVRSTLDEATTNDLPALGTLGIASNDPFRLNKGDLIGIPTDDPSRELNGLRLTVYAVIDANHNLLAMEAELRALIVKYEGGPSDITVTIT